MVSSKGYFSNGTTFDAVVATFISSSVKFYLIPPDTNLPLTKSTFTTALDKESWKLVRFSLSEIEMKTLDDKYVIFPCQYQNNKVLWVSILNQKIPENVTKVASELFKNIETASQKTVERCYLLWNEPKHVTEEINEQKPATNRPGSQLEIKQDVVKSNLHPENDQKPLPNNPSCVKHHCEEKESPMFSLQSIVVPRSFTPNCKSLGNRKGILVTKRDEKVRNTKEKRVRFFISESYKSYKQWRETRGGIPLLKTCHYRKRQVNNRASYLSNMTSNKQNNTSFVKVDRFLPNLTSTTKSVNTKENLTSNMKFLYKEGDEPIDFRKNHAFREDGHKLNVKTGRHKISGLEEVRTNKQSTLPFTKEKKIMGKSVTISNDSPRKRHLNTCSIHEGPMKAICPSSGSNRSSERVSYANNQSSERVSCANNQSSDFMCFNKEDTNQTTSFTPMHPRFKFLKHQNKINHLANTKEISAYKHTVQRTVADDLPQQRKRIKSSKNARIISVEKHIDNRQFPKTLSKNYNTQISEINEDKKQRQNITKEKFNPQLIIQDCLSKCCQVTKPSTGVATFTGVKPIGTKESLFPYWSQASKNVEQLSYGAREIIIRGKLAVRIFLQLIL